MSSSSTSTIETTPQVSRDEALRRLDLVDCVAIYCDGGLIGPNPSWAGGVWAWVGVNASDQRLAVSSGVVRPRDNKPVGNNLAEFVAAIQALEAVPAGWAGTLYTDSLVTLGRLRHGWTLSGVPHYWVHRGAAALDRVGEFQAVLLQGHPTEEELETGNGRRRGLPVSRWNVLADQMCQEKAREYLAQARSEQRAMEAI